MAPLVPFLLLIYVLLLSPPQGKGWAGEKLDPLFFLRSLVTVNVAPSTFFLTESNRRIRRLGAFALRSAK